MALMNRAVQRWIVLLFLACLILFYTASIKGLDSNVPSFLKGKVKHIDWKKIPQKHPVSTFIPLPTEAPRSLPKVQANFKPETADQKQLRQERKEKVKAVFMRSWSAYKTHAWGHDEITPLAGAWRDHFGGWGATLVDTLDTLLIMDLDDEFKDAVQACKSIDFSVTHVGIINVFETTIRYLGGLLSAHELAQGKDGGTLLNKAKELGEMLYHAFDNENRMPVARWTWSKSYEGEPEKPYAYTLAAELGSMSLEFTRLSQLTGDPRWYDAIQRITNVLESEQKQTKIPGLWPISFNAETMLFRDDSEYTLGGRADSMYEYIPKEYIILGGNAEQYRRMYLDWLEAAKDHLFFRPMNPNNLDIIISGTADIRGDKIELRPEGQHLSCFLGGLIALGSKIFDRTSDLDVAKKLVDGCIWAYGSTATHIMPEVFKAIPPTEKSGVKNKWDKNRWLEAVMKEHPVGSKDEVKDAKDEKARAEKMVQSLRLPEGMPRIPDPRYILRPEAIESLFILYRITGDKEYQENAWKMFEAIEKSTRTEFTYSSILDVTIADGTRTDASESFWMAETLKYFYLIFSEPDHISLDDYVFNTEAHPLKIPKST